MSLFTVTQLVAERDLFRPSPTWANLFFFLNQSYIGQAYPQSCPCLCEGVAGRRPAMPHEGLLKVESGNLGLGVFGVLGVLGVLGVYDLSV